MDNMQLWLTSSTDSINLNDAANGFFLNPDLEGLTGTPEIRSVNGLNAGYDGGWTATQLWAARLITIRGVIALNDKAAVETKRKALAKLMAQGKNESLQLKFVSEAGNVYTTSVRTTYCTMALQRVFWRQEYQIQLRADDPLIYDDGGAELVAILRVMAGVNGFEIPFEIPFAIGDSADPTDVNVGDEATYPLITLKGDLHSPAIVNLTTNQQMQVLADIITHVEWKAYTTAQTIDGYLKIQDGLQDAPLTLTKLTGNATQKTLSGKNKANISVIPDQTAASLKITVANDTITIKDNSNAVGYTNTQKKLSEICPSLQVGDTVYLFFDTTSTTAPNKNRVYLGGAYWDKSTSQTITQTMLDAQLVFYGGHDETAVISNFMITKTNDATYEPYVGGIPSPNPDFPQAINTVSGEQTVKITGKNLQPTTWAQDFVNAVNTSNLASLETFDGKNCLKYQPNAGYNSYPTKNFTLGVKFKENTQYTISFDEHSTTSNRHVAFYYTDGTYSTYTATSANTWTRVSMTSTAGKTVAYVAPFYTSGTTHIDIDTFQLEEGTQASQFEPYQAQEYTIDLGSEELAKIGTYQDYIYNDNGTWKIHKAIGKVVLNGTETVSNIDTTQATTTRVGFWGIISSAPSVGATLAHNISNYFVWNAGIWASDNAGLYTGGNDLVFRGAQTTIGTTEAQIKTWLSAHNTIVYYPLATPTDTEITDSGLIAQLNHIYELYQGTNNLFLIPSAGAQGEMEVTYATDKDVDYHEVVIDCQARTVTQDGQNLYPALAPGSEFIQLVPGQNRLYLTSTVSSDDGTAEVKFKKGNISI